MLMHKIRSHMRASDVCFCVCRMFSESEKWQNYMCAASSISLMWICIDVNDAMGDTSTPARQNSTAHWANTLMVNKNKLCARSLVRIWITTTTTTTARMYLQRSNRFLLTMMWMRCWRWWQCGVRLCVCVTVINIPSASTIPHVDFSRTMWHLKDKWLHVGRISFKYIFAVIHIVCTPAMRHWMYPWSRARYLCWIYAERVLIRVG